MLTKILSLSALLAYCLLPSQTAAEELQLSNTFQEYKKIKFKEVPLKEYYEKYTKPVSPSWKTFSLDGTWRFKRLECGNDFSNPLNDSEMAKGSHKAEFDDKGWEDRTVPSPTYGLYANGDGSRNLKLYKMKGAIGWYRRDFDLTPEQIKGNQVIIDFRRAGWQTDIWVNGRKAGNTHKTRFDGFQYDVTPFIKPGKNLLAVRVYDYLGHTSYHCRGTSGISSPVKLVLAPTPVYSFRMKIDCRHAERAIELAVEFSNTTGKVQKKALSIVLGDLEGKELEATKAETVTIPPGKHWVKLGKHSLKNLKDWSPETPNMHTLAIKDSKGTTLAFDRFGFRDFLAKGEWLLLNGKKFKPRGTGMSRTEGPRMPDILRYLKKMNMNFGRSHSKNGVPREMFASSCDFGGFIDYFDWSGPSIGGAAYGTGEKEGILETAEDLKECILDNYNHPSICMWSFGNEYYNYSKGYTDRLNKLYEMVKKIDTQNRPVCTSSGRHTLSAVTNPAHKDKTDILDDHQYTGCSCGSWQDNIAYINDYAVAAMKSYGAIPKIDCEYADPGIMGRHYSCSKTAIRIFKLPPNSDKFKEEFIKMVTGGYSKLLGSVCRLGMNYRSTRINFTDEREKLKLYATKTIKRIVEIYRRAGTKCLGGHPNTSLPNLFFNGGSYYTLAWWGTPGPIEPRLGEDTYTILPVCNTFSKIYNPTLVTADIFNTHPIPGSKQAIPLLVVNDTQADASFAVKAQFRFDEKVYPLPEIDFGKVASMDNKKLQLSYTAPQTAKALRGNLELYLFKNGKRVGDNYYHVAIVPADEQLLKTDGKIALYDACAKVFGALIKDTTTRALKQFDFEKGKIERIDNFDNLANYKHLIIGNNSFDEALINNSDKITKWVENGGKLLCLEQRFCGRVPFAGVYKVVSGTPGNYVSLTVVDHPLFRNLKQEDFDTWNGQRGLMFSKALSPLNVGLVAVAPTASHHDPRSIKTVIADIKLGKGEIIFNQLNVVSRVGSDSVARAYFMNLMRCLLEPGVSEFAAKMNPKDFKKTLFVSKEDTFTVDLRKFANRSFADEKTGDKKGGWTDFGSRADFPDIPPGKSYLEGGVLFDVIDPAKNNDKSCIVLKGEKRPYFPESVKGIPVNEYLNEIYFLHTSMYGKKGPVLEYVIHYEDGKTETFKANCPDDLPDWWRGQEQKNASVVFRSPSKSLKCLFLSEFLNPYPKNKVKSIDIISKGGSIPIIIAISGRKRYMSVVSGVGER